MRTRSIVLSDLLALPRISPIRSSIGLAIATIVVSFAGPAWSQTAGFLDPRPELIKPEMVELAPGSDPRRCQVKFIDDLNIGLEAAGFPTDRSRISLNSGQAIAAMTGIQAAGGRWSRNTGATEAVLDDLRRKAEINLGREIADLNNFFILEAPDQIDITTWMEQLNDLDDVELAFPLRLPVAPPTPGDFTANQGYLDPTTDGIDAEFAWTLPGGTGSNVVIVDLEYTWNLNHDDLPAITTIIPPGRTANDPFGENNHGTAVLGELASLNNGFGTTGCAYGATIRVAPTSFTDGYLLNEAFQNALLGLSAGDCVLFEQQIQGPNYIDNTSQFGLIAVEWDLAVYSSIVTAVGNGIHVIEAAGNGSQNFDAPEYGVGNGGHWPFLPANDSGAIIVGAGAAPAAFNGSDTDRSRLDFSNYGSRVNLQGWGQRVWTTGYGDGYSAEGVDLWYDNSFGGTSSASPIVTSAVALLESWHESEFGSVVTPAVARTLLVSTGAAQQSGTFPASENIGPRPNLSAAICTFDAASPTIDCPDDIVVECSEYDGTPATDTEIAAFLAGAIASDDFDPSPVITTDAPALFPDGPTTVTFTATDACGKTSSCQATVTVVDTTPPVITCPDAVTVECSSHCGTVETDPQLVDFFNGVSAVDICDPDPTFSNNAPDCFPDGVTTDVIFTAMDADGNASSCTTSVTVEDTTPPEIEVVLNRDALWPPNHKMADITATVEVTDICDPMPTFVLTSITSDEPDNGLGDGDTANDIQFTAYGTADVAFQLRSERAGGRDGRKYTIIYTAMDMSGNTTPDTVCVIVPHDQRGHAMTMAGFLPNSNALDPSLAEFQLVLPSWNNLDARRINPASVLVGNSIGAVRAHRFEYRDVNGDRSIDLTLWYESRPALEMRKQGGKRDPVGLHYWGSDGQGYLLDDINKLEVMIEVAVAAGGGESSLPEDGSAIDTDLPGSLPDDNPTTGFDDLGGLVLSESGPVTVELFDVTGRKVRTLLSGDMTAGHHELSWDGRDDAGRAVSSGLYFYRVRTSDGVLSRKLMLSR